MPAKSGAGGPSNHLKKVEHARLTKEQLLDKLRRRTGEFAVEGLGTIVLRGIDVNNAALAFPGTEDDAADRQKRICLLGILEPKLEPEDLEAFGEASAGLINKIVDQVLRLSGFTGESAASFLTPVPH